MDIEAVSCLLACRRSSWALLTTPNRRQCQLKRDRAALGFDYEQQCLTHGKATRTIRFVRTIHVVLLGLVAYHIYLRMDGGGCC